MSEKLFFSYPPENDETLLREQENNTKSNEYDSFVNNSEKIGAKILAQVNFEDRHKKITNSSYQKVLKSGETIDAKASERRSIAYIQRLENLIDKYGSSVERKLWRQSTDKLIISPDDILDEYWIQQEQLLRDQGHGNYGIDDDEKEFLAINIQKAQRDSLELWSNYLGDVDCPFPMWFKVYAWDGMSKMGTFNQEKKSFTKRDKHTVAPYPKLNPSALAKVYELILNFYGKEHSENKTNNEMSGELKTLVETGNFNKLYSKMLLGEKRFVKTPENPDDVVGEWVEYLPGDEEKLAEAAEGTPWCISSTYMGSEYLQSRETQQDNKAKFLLFHLTDPETGLPAKSACASIRLDSDGMVDEISGLGDLQTLEDALVPTVFEKVKTLQGGEKFLEAFADNNMLISLDRKMKKGDELTREEFEFIYEISRPIKSLCKYGYDPRISELKQNYNPIKALEAGIEPEKLIQHMKGEDLILYLPTMIKYGIGADDIVSALPPSLICANFDKLDQYGAKVDIKEIVSNLSPNDTVENLSTLIEHGAIINYKELIDNLKESAVEKYSTRLILYGANLQDVSRKLDKNSSELLSKMSPSFIIGNLNKLMNCGFRANDIVDCLGADYVWGERLVTLLDYGADQNSVLETMSKADLSLELETLLNHGINAKKILPFVDGFIISQDDNCELLIKNGASIDEIIETVGDAVDNYEVLKTLAKNGADMHKIVPRISNYSLKHDGRIIKLLQQYGVEVNQ